MAVHVVYLFALWSFATGLGGDTPVTGGRGDGGGASIVQGLVGRVLTTDGRPIANAWVRPTSLDHPSHPIPEMAIVTDAHGWYRWPLAPGTYGVIVSAVGFREATLRTTVRRGTTTTLDVVLERAP